MDLEAGPQAKLGFPAEPLRASDSMSSVWGDVFEVAVKRGVLSFLAHQGVIRRDWPGLMPWCRAKPKDVLQHCLGQAETVDANARRLVSSYHDHLLVVGYGNGWTVAREWWRGLPKRSRFKEAAAIWCDLDLKERRPGHEAYISEEERLAKGREFGNLFGIAVAPERLVAKGAPANADFLLMLEGRRRQRRLLCLAFSLNVPPEIDDFGTEEAHAREVSRYTRLVSGRGVFSNLAAEVEGAGFTVSSEMVDQLLAFTGRDKPLYKLMQGCSYASVLAAMLPREVLAAGLPVDVVAVTAAGIESVNAPLGAGSQGDAKRQLVEALGSLYRSADQAERPFGERLEGVYRLIPKGLPRALRQGLSSILDVRADRALAPSAFTETMTGFRNPNEAIPWREALGWVEGCDTGIEAFLGAPAPQALGGHLHKQARCGSKKTTHGGEEGSGQGVKELDRPPESGAEPPVTLRALNEAAIATAVREARPGALTVLGLLGHPGIGKTTSLLKALPGAERCFFAYFSPRVVINADVTRSIVEGFAPGACAVTANHNLIAGAASWAESQGVKARVISAVVVEANSGAVRMRDLSEGGVLHLTPDQATQIAEGRHRRASYTVDVDERTMHLEDVRTPGVLQTLASECRRLMRMNPGAPAVAMTAAIQGFRQTGAVKTTINTLGHLFETGVGRGDGIDERRAMAAERPLVLVMVDEITGDGAGAPMVHAVADWLRREFLDPFGESSLFRCVLILADASLSTPEAFRSYLESAAGVEADEGEDKRRGWAEAPQRLTITPGGKGQPFELATGRFKVGQIKTDVLHVMADGYPAGKLEVEYAVRIDTLDMARAEAGDARRLARQAHGERIVIAAAARIAEAVRAHPDQQTIYFAQDKAFLKVVRKQLVRGHGMQWHDVAELHGSVDAMRRRQLMQEHVRDSKRVFLMTSAGSRGISFPKATTLTILVPRFEIEASLMEVSQMVFRGRGRLIGPDGTKLSGNGFDRRIVFMVEDLVRTEEDGTLDPVRWVRQKIDLAGMVLLLRATLETRIKGRCAEGFCGAVVPVGQIGLETAAKTMATQVEAFLKECRIAVVEEGTEASDAARAAQGHAAALFRNLHWRALKRNFRFFANEEVALAFRKALGVASGPLLAGAQGCPIAAVPEHAYFIGPTVMEDWSGIDLSEIFSFGVSMQDGAALRRLKGGCLALTRNAQAPRSLARAADDVLTIISRNKDELRDLEFSTKKRLRASTGWIVLPADYARFIADREAEHDRRQRKLCRPDGWASWMRTCASLHRRPGHMVPIVPEYDDKPFAAALIFGDPTGLRRGFDNRYFTSTTEFNLLNALLYGPVGQP